MAEVGFGPGVHFVSSKHISMCLSRNEAETSDEHREKGLS